MAARKKTRRYGKKASKSVEGAMRRGKGGRGGRVKSRDQAIAIGLSEAREKGARVPVKKRAAKKRASSRPAKKGARR